MRSCLLLVSIATLFALAPRALGHSFSPPFIGFSRGNRSRHGPADL